MVTYREMGGYKQIDGWLSKEMVGDVERWLAKLDDYVQRNGWLNIVQQRDGQLSKKMCPNQRDGWLRLKMGGQVERRLAKLGG